MVERKTSEISVGLIPAAGKGTRMGYLSHLLPKTLFPIYDKPLIHHIVDNMRRVGVKRIYVIVHYNKEKIIDYLKNQSEISDVTFEFIAQKELSGIANAILLTENKITTPFITILGDDCTVTPSLSNLVTTFYEKKAVVVEGVVEENNPEVLKQTCCVRSDSDGRILEIIEKPQNPSSNLRGTGVYVFDPRIFEEIKKTHVSSVRNEREITDTIGNVARLGKSYAAKINGINININNYENLLSAWEAVKKLNSGDP